MSAPARIGLLYPGDAAARARSDPAASRFAALFDAFAAAGEAARPLVYDEAWADALRDELLGLRAVLVWHNPVENGRPRTRLDALLREVAAAGVFVSSHPDTIDALGTKDVLLAVRGLPFGSDCHHVASPAQLQAELPARLRQGPRVIKRWRGHSGQAVWKLSAAGDQVLVRPAQRGSREQLCDWAELQRLLAPCFDEPGAHAVDQAWQPRLAEGMWRAYFVGAQLAGFGFQAINALHPDHPDPGPRHYHPPEAPGFEPLRDAIAQGEWVRLLGEALGLPEAQLPLLWDADFLRGAGDGWVLCEINASSVSPFPPSAIAPLVAATLQRI